MSSYANLKTMSASERNKLHTGPRVYIYVGPKGKIYSLPRALLCYFSPAFERLFNASKGTKFEMPDLAVEDCDLLVEHMLRGTIPGTTNVKRSIEGNKETIAKCLKFLELAHRFEFADVSALVYEPMRNALHDLAGHKHRNNIYDMQRATKAGVSRCGIEESEIELIFKHAPVDGKLCSLAAQAALSFSGPRDVVKMWDEQIRELPGFASLLMEQVVAAFGKQAWTEPFSKQQRRQ